MPTHIEYRTRGPRWNGTPYLSPLWARCPHITLVHHVHKDMWRLVLEEKLAGARVLAPSAIAAPGKMWTDAQGELPNPVPTPPIWRKVICERRATFACRPNLTRPDHRTPDPRILRAGDYTWADYPATLEGAVRSGRRAAHALLIKDYNPAS